MSSDSAVNHHIPGAGAILAPVFVSDASVEAEGIVSALRTRGYGVVEVPLGLLQSRVQAQNPGLILCDADALGAVEAIRRICAMPDYDALNVVFLGEPRGTGRGLVERLNTSSQFFDRPVDVPALLRRIDEILGQRLFRLPIPRSPRPRTLVQDFPGAPTHNKAGSAQAIGPASGLSPELHALLSTAERRVQSTYRTSVPEERPTPEAELESLLPDDWLNALDDPLDPEDADPDRDLGTDGGDRSKHTLTGGRRAEDTRSHAPPARQEIPSMPADAAAEPSTPPREQVSTTPPRPKPGRPEFSQAPATPPPSPPLNLATPLLRTPDFEVPSTLGSGAAVRVLGQAILSRYSGAIAFEDSQGIRRVVLRDGDFVTLSSGVESESLVSFLVERGDMPVAAERKLIRKLPQFGRHAGAALIAQGYLRQDDLWNVLRAHAEWLLMRVLGIEQGAASLERDLAVRLRAEPGVFGGATGGEVLVEIVRRAIPPEVALARIGGNTARLTAGPMLALLGECALPDAEALAVRQVNDLSIQEFLEGVDSSEFVAAVYALVELGVLSTHPKGPDSDTGSLAPQLDLMDEQALAAKVKARRLLVDEGDYFAILGVSRKATTYDIRRAYVALRAEFDPNRIVTQSTPAMREDLELIQEILEEACEILSDATRRERYRKALEAPPS